MGAKPKTPQPQNGDAQVRDMFASPAYATDLLVPYIPKMMGFIWEPAAGEGRMVRRLMHHGYEVFGSDKFPKDPHNDVSIDFLTAYPHRRCSAVVTNPPYSLKDAFARRCMELGCPWALLVPADFSQWVIKALDEWGCQGVMPTRRIDYLTPDVCGLVFRGETLLAINRALKGTGVRYQAKQWKQIPPNLIEKHATARYDRPDDIPQAVIAKHSKSQFQSMWLCWGFAIPKERQFVFPELTLEMKQTAVLA